MQQPFQDQLPFLREGQCTATGLANKPIYKAQLELQHSNKDDKEARTPLGAPAGSLCSVSDATSHAGRC